VRSGGGLEGARERDPGSRRDIGGLRERPAGAPGRNGEPSLLLHSDSLEALFCHFGVIYFVHYHPLGSEECRHHLAESL
jgi:hypothetical protein